MNKPSRRCLFATRKKLSTLVWKTTTLKFMDKRVVVYCTGGVRCEKFSGWMVREGYKDVGQLHGGIATYGKDPEVQGELWDGKMYVFD
ncbi:rhodanese-like domain-containing protein, partial [Streptococcus pneumoniae]|uniref:rhodanese-like domain-containing protein n=1 Tax=Streptococcus pneumoniae TaxID=1313 RepID=UPI00396F5A45